MGASLAKLDGPFGRWTKAWNSAYERDAFHRTAPRVAFPLAQLETGPMQGLVRIVNGLVYAVLTPVWGLPAALAMTGRTVLASLRSASAEAPETPGRPAQPASRVTSEDERYTFVNEPDHSVTMVDNFTGKEVRRFHGPKHTITTLAASADGSRLAASSRDLTLRIWDTGTGKEIAKHEYHTNHILSMVFSRDGKDIFLGYRTGMVFLDDATGGRLPGRSSTRSSFDTDDRPVVSLRLTDDEKQVLIGLADGGTLVWELDPARRGTPEGWKASVRRDASDAFEDTRGLWDNAGRNASFLITNGNPDTAVRSGFAGLGLGLAGILGGFAAVLSGFAYPVHKALSVVRWVLEQVWPTLRKVLDFAYRLLKRVVPFLYGLVEGTIMGGLGAVAFGMLHLGRPWVKHVARQPYDESSFGRWVSTRALMAAAFVSMIVFGAAGAAVGLLVALPFSLTYMAAKAFQRADITGSVSEFFRHWRETALPEELKPLEQLTDSYEFPKAPKDGFLQPEDGWMRFGVIAMVSFTAPFAGAVAALAAYGRSIAKAWRAVRDSGKSKTPVTD
jgi:hypothetical protein